MATLKHINSKNADYGAAEQYLLFEHDEFTMKPVLDETGRLIPREDYRLSTLNCGGEDFAVACMRANLRYGKNQRREDVKSHHYIISFDPRDGPDNGLTVDRAQALGEKFCAEHFPGHQALVCTHPDGHNHSGNISCIDTVEKNFRDGLQKFLAHQDSIWYDVFSLSQSMYQIAVDSSKAFSDYYRTSLEPSKRASLQYTFIALEQIHGRACQEFLEILYLIQGHKKGLNKEEKQNLKDAVKSIYSPRRLADGEAMMCEIQGAQEDFVRRWEMCFREYPDILTEPKNNEKLLIFIDRASRYLQTVKDRLNNDRNQNSQTV